MSESLYSRLGGYDGIARIVDDVMNNHLANKTIKARFEVVDDLDHAKKMAVDFFAAGSGGDQAYTGKSMLDAHRGMNISEQEYMAATDDILAALDKHGIDGATRTEVLGILYSLKDEIIRV